MPGIVLTGTILEDKKRISDQLDPAAAKNFRSSEAELRIERHNLSRHDIFRRHIVDKAGPSA